VVLTRERLAALRGRFGGGNGWGGHVSPVLVLAAVPLSASGRQRLARLCGDAAAARQKKAVAAAIAHPSGWRWRGR